MNASAFIKAVALAAAEQYERYEILPSVTAAIAIAESGWGKTSAARLCCNPFGILWRGQGERSMIVRRVSDSGSFTVERVWIRKFQRIGDGVVCWYESMHWADFCALSGEQTPETACIQYCRQHGGGQQAAHLIALLRRLGLENDDRRVQSYRFHSGHTVHNENFVSTHNYEAQLISL